MRSIHEANHLVESPSNEKPEYPPSLPPQWRAFADHLHVL